MINSGERLEKIAKKIKAVQGNYICCQFTAEKAIKVVDVWGRVSFESIRTYACPLVPVWEGKVKDFI
jgi:hypothetical protein